MRSLAGRRGTAAHGATSSTEKAAILLTGAELTLPPALLQKSATLTLSTPPLEEYRELLARVLRDLGRRMPVRVEMTPREIDQLLHHVRGLTLLEAERIFSRAIVDDGALTPADMAKVIAAKRKIVEREGLLEYHPAEGMLGEIAGLDGLKGWLARRRSIILDPEGAARVGLPFPKGILLVGVPGCGKSLSAKAVAAEWGLPLLRLDPANLYDKYIGESERNFKRALQTAERLSPVVLWIDELEKAFAVAGEGDGGVSLRVLGIFLSWMQERKGDVFIVATANDVSRLPPEFLRKGRFNEIFFVDLPDHGARRALLEIQLRRRGRDPAGLDLDTLARACDGFSGAEIEQAIISALYAAFANGAPLSMALLLEEFEGTRPLAEVMPERIEALRGWARGRTVPA